MCEDTRYVARDGTEFRNPEECEAHEALLDAVDAIMAPIPVDPWSLPHGTYVQLEDLESIKAAKIAILRLTAPYFGEPQKDAFGLRRWIAVNIEAIESHPRQDDGNTTEACDADSPLSFTWTRRFISNSCPRPIANAWRRLCCIDSRGRAWQQMYFRLRPTHGHGEHKPQ